MPFREAATPAAIRPIRYGPFPARWGRVGFAAALVFVGATLRFSTGTELVVECRRRPGQDPTCVRTQVAPFIGRSDWSFRDSDVGEVRAVYRPGSRRGSAGHWDVVVLDLRGAETQLATRSSETEATAIRDQIDRFARDPSATSVRVETPAQWWSSASMIVAGLGAFALLVGAFAGAGRIRIDIDRAQDVLSVTRTLFGFRRGSVEHRLGDFRGVRVEEGDIADRLRASNRPAARGWRVALVRPGGNGVAIDDAYRGRRRVHDRCAAELRVALGFPGVPESVPEQVVSPQTVRPRQGLRKVLLLLGGAFVLATGGTALMTWHANRTQGWLELRAAARCKFQGAEILPGGWTRMSLDPGRYEVEIYDPALPGKWERRSFEIRVGEETFVTCRPAAGIVPGSGDQRPGGPNG